MRFAPTILALSLASFAFSGCPRGPRAPEVRVDVPIGARYELELEAPADTQVIETQVTDPKGRVTTVGAFPRHGRFASRYTPRESGRHSWVAISSGREIDRGAFVATAPPPGTRTRTGAGFVHRDPVHAHRLVRDDGSTVFVLGENRINVYDPAWNYENVDSRTYLKKMAAYGMTAIRVFVFADCESETVRGGYQIGCLEPEVGKFDERTADAFDEIFSAAEENDLDVILVAFAIGFTPGPETWRSWNDNPYHRLAEKPADFFTRADLREHAKKKLRYIADRWAASPRLLAIDLLNEPEWDGPIGERTWIPWAEEMAAAWRSFDPYGHLVTVGPVGLHWNFDGDERPWYGSRANDIVQWHLYGKEFYDPHALGIEMARKVAETWGFDKPVLCGEFAYGGEDKSTYDHTHVGIFSLLFSGAGALAHTAPPFEIDSDEPMTPERGAHFKVLSQLLASLDPKKSYEPSSDAMLSSDGGRVFSLVSLDSRERLLWILGPKSSYGDVVEGARVTLPGARHRVRWIDDVTGATLVEESASPPLGVPPFRRHIAARIVAE